MSIAIGQYIEYLLIHRGNVSLPGLGSISLIQRPAYFTQGKTKINPPSLDFVYTENEQLESHLSQLISKSEGIHLEEAQKNVNKYSQSILNNYLNYDVATIPNIGIIQKEGTETKFVPHESFTINAYNGLQPVAINPLRKLKIENLESSIPSTIEEKSDWITYLGALLLGAIMIFSYHYFVNPLETSIENKATIPSSYNESSLPANVNDNNNHEDTDLVQKPVNVDLLVQNNQDSVAKQDNLRTREEVTVLPDKPKSQQKKIPVDSSGISIAKPKKDQKCIILVGVYNRPIEAIVMEDRIKAKGYTPFRDVKYDANRVGVQFNCAEKDPKQMLAEIQDLFNNDAYYLQPKITI